ncbi:MAG: ATP-binding protein [Pyrinomonadaceae bacterium]|nr:ATP-binding protein [Pyrinomonadaceae bacterium]
MPQQKAKDHNLKAVPPRAVTPDVSDLALDSEVCRICGGTGMEVIPGKGARKCECRNTVNGTDPLKASRIPAKYQNASFESFLLLDPHKERALKKAFDFTKQYPKVTQGLLLMGPVGVGKTHLAISILKELIETKNCRCLFYEFNALLKEIQGSYNPATQASEMEILSPIMNVDLLVLDELGASKPTDWVRDTLGHIINSRYNNNKFTIFTTNYLDERPNDRDETLEDRIGIRTRSRLYEMCQTVVIKGDDFRRTFNRTAAANR